MIPVTSAAHSDIDYSVVIVACMAYTLHIKISVFVLYFSDRTFLDQMGTPGGGLSVLSTSLLPDYMA
jgi:hypothetical protein